MIATTSARTIRIASVVRAFFLTLGLVWGAYWLAWWRTQDFGFTWNNIFADIFLTLFFVLPVAALTVFGLPWRKAIRAVLLIGVVSIIVAEAYGGAQEWWVVRRYGENPGKEMFVQRWPPFKDHFIGYSVGYGWMGGD